MLPAQLEYTAPATVDEAVRALAATPGALPVAGSYHLLIDLRMRRVTPPALVDLRHIPGLRGIAADGDGLRIGAMTTLDTIMNDAAVTARYGALAEAAASSGDPQMRNMDAIGGHLSYLPTGSHLAAAVLALGAVIEAQGPGGPRAIPADEFVAGGPRAGELVVAVRLPAAPAASAYETFAHPAHLGAVCGVAACVTPNGGVTLGVTGAAERPARLATVESALAGRPLTGEAIGQAVAGAAQGLALVSDLQFSADYRAHLVGLLSRRALERCARAL